MGDSKAVDAVRSAVAALNNGDIDGYLGFAPKGQLIDVETWVYGDLGQLPRQIAAEEGDVT